MCLWGVAPLERRRRRYAPSRGRDPRSRLWTATTPGFGALLTQVGAQGPGGVRCVPWYPAIGVPGSSSHRNSLQHTILPGKSSNEPADFELGALGAPGRETPIDRYRRVEWVCEAARDAIWSFWRSFCGPQSPRSRRRRGKIRHRLRAPKTLQVVCAGSS
jgi:hypothetical protein